MYELRHYALLCIVLYMCAGTFLYKHFVTAALSIPCKFSYLSYRVSHIELRIVGCRKISFGSCLTECGLKICPLLLYVGNVEKEEKSDRCNNISAAVSDTPIERPPPPPDVQPKWVSGKRERLIILVDELQLCWHLASCI